MRFFRPLLLALCFVAPSMRAQQADTTATSGYEQWVRRGMTALQADSLAQAEDCFRQAMRLRPAAPGNYLLFRYIGQIQERQGKREEALQTYTLALGFKPKSAELLLDRAALHYRLGLEERALMDYNETLDVDYTNTEALFMRGHILAAKHDYKRARLDYEAVLSREPNHERALLGLALLNDRDNRPREAMEQMDRLVQLHPSRAIFYAVRGGMEQARKRYEAALHDLSTAIRLEPTNADYYVSRASLYMEMRKKKLARQDALLAVKFGADAKEMASLLK